MAGSRDRLAMDLHKVRDLAQRSHGILTLGLLKTPPAATLLCRFRIPTAKDADYPSVHQELSEVIIRLPPRYPFARPMVLFRTPIWNPNVFPNGLLCSGRWKVMEYLDLFVLRLMKLIALDPAVTNPGHLANRQAAAWYRAMLWVSPELFPTMRLDDLPPAATALPIGWRDLR